MTQKCLNDSEKIKNYRKIENCRCVGFGHDCTGFGHTICGDVIELNAKELWNYWNLWGVNNLLGVFNINHFRVMSSVTAASVLLNFSLFS